MMEVKHSPSSQMDFRTARNGLPAEEEDEEMDTLLEGGIVKSIPASSIECDSTPLLNGKVKHSQLEDGMEIDLLDDEMDDELNSAVDDSMKKEELDSKKEDIDLFDLELEEAAPAETETATEEKLTNGETTDSSSVRDTGDDLDTLLSKINDLVEDCMEPSTGIESAPTKTTKAVKDDDDVELIENEVEIASDDKSEEPQAKHVDDTLDEIVEETLEEIVEESVVEIDEEDAIAVAEVSSEVKEEQELDLDADENENVGDEVPEDIPEENGEEVTVQDLEMAEEEDAEEVVEEVPAVAAEEIASEVTAPEIPEIDASEIVEEEEISEEIVEETEVETVNEATTEIVDKVSEETIEESTKEAAEDHVTETAKQVVEEASKEEEKVSEEATTEMEVDDDIVCLDSPMAEENMDENNEDIQEPTEKPSVPAPQEEKDIQMDTEEKEVSKECKVAEKEVLPAEIKSKEDAKPAEDEDEIFLIEDDDDDEDEPMKKAEVPSKPTENNEESTKSATEDEKSKEEETKKDSKPEEEEDEEKKTEVLAKEKPSENKENDDEIVCLDDSFEETEKEEAVSKPEEKKKEEEDSEKKQIEASIEAVTEKIDDVDASEEISKDKAVEKVLSVDKQLEKEAKDETVEKVTEKKVEEAALKDKVAAEETKEEVPIIADEAEKSAEKSVKTVKESDAAVKPSEEVVDEVPKKTAETETPEKKETPPASVSESEKSSKTVIDSDIINLDDDDEDEATTSTDPKEDKSSKEVSVNKCSAFLPDNSDNARDGVDEKDDKNEPKVSDENKSPPIIPSESNSNSSSNLLKESAITEREESRSEPSEQPPAKRIRLSQDEEASSRNSNGSQDDTSSKLLDDDDVMEVNVNDSEENKKLKRVHSTESISSDFKKPKTDSESPKVADEEKLDLLKEIVPAKVERVKEEDKDDKKSVEVKPLPLYPPPKLDAPKIGLSLDFLRRFKKSIHKMNKSDLEELVLQKIVEAIVHKSEFSEMRELIEKQEKIISGHRTKITELNKQFRDLEMVHNRVLKDLETKNSQFIMPVKITRAVGLQVFFPNKKSDQPMAALVAASSAQASSASSMGRSVSTSSSTSSIPEKTSLSSPAAINNPVPQTSVTAPTAGMNLQQRRGCVQKLTPMRPDGPRHAIPNRGITPGVVSSSTPSPMTPKDASPKVLNRQMVPKPRMSQSPVGLNTSNSSLPQPTAHTLPVAPTPDERPKVPTLPQGIATKKTGGGAKPYPPPSKRIPKSWQSDQTTPVQTPPMQSPTASSLMAHLQSSIVNTSLAAKTPNKSVIDLTDEDDVVPAPSPRTPTNTAATAKQTNNAPTHRVGPYKVSVIPAAQLQHQQQQQQQQQQPRPNPPKQTATRPINAPQPAPKPNGTAQNAVRRTSPPVQQQRYHHPAPLPNQPIHSSNPLWKLPPARPTIRISNLDSGIVISWTIEDTAKEKYAESTSYQIYAYQETSGPPLVESWRHVGDVKAMLLPMAVTLTQFQEGQRYYFAVRAVDAHNRCGPFSFAKTWS